MWLTQTDKWSCQQTFDLKGSDKNTSRLNPLYDMSSPGSHTLIVLFLLHKNIRISSVSLQVFRVNRRRTNECRCRFVSAIARSRQGAWGLADLNYLEEFLFSAMDVSSLKFRYNKFYMAAIWQSTDIGKFLFHEHKQRNRFKIYINKIQIICATLSSSLFLSVI